MKSGFKHWLTESCILYSILVIFINLIYLIADSDPNFPTSRTLLLVPAAMVISLATSIRTSEKITGVLRWMLHCPVTVAGCYLFIVLPIYDEQSGAEKLVGLVTVLVVYLIVVLLLSLTLKKVRDAVKEDKKYRKK